MKMTHLALALGAITTLAGCGGSGGDGGADNASSIATSSSSAPASSSSAMSSSSSSEPLSTYENPTIDPSLVSYNDVAVHDPSVIRAENGTYYVVGSHLGFAKSEDLVNWELVATGVNDANPLFDTYATEIAEGIEYTGGYVGSWASDIIQLENGDYYFYYNHCTNPASGACDAPRSYLGVATSADVEGPYVDQGIFLYSGQTDAEMAGEYGVGDVTSFDATVHPNAIDPTAYYDADGNLWMIYGSYSGGLYILAMDEQTGKPEPGQGYGKHIGGGDHSAIEGSFVLYSPETEYYYLFASFGGFVSTDGYNIRVARSENPDGPFLDAAGNDIKNARGGWDSIEPYGNKLMGGFIFESHPGSDAGSRGYLAPGHNSAYYDAETGQHYLITHTRFPNRGEQHAIRVHELWINEDGWPVASPQRYAPIEGEKAVDYQDIVGDYQIINHGHNINRDPHLSQAARLNADGSITGEVSGQYQLHANEPGRITITLEDGTVFEGMAKWQWNARTETLVPTFSALSGGGVSLWGLQLSEKDNGQIMQAIVEDLELPADFKGDRLELPTEGARGASISWETDMPGVISASGDVTRPNPGEGDATATLTATISRNGVQSQESFTVTVPARVAYNRVAQYLFEGDLTASVGEFGPGMATADRIHNSGSVAYDAGQTGQALMLNGTNGVRLPDGLIDNYEYTVSLWVNPAAITANTPAFFGAVNQQTDDAGGLYSNQWVSLLPEGWNGTTMVWSGSQTWVDVLAEARIPADQWTHLAFSVDSGSVSLYIDGVQAATGTNLPDFFSDHTGLFALGVNYWDTPYNGLIDSLNIYDATLTGGEIQALDIDKLADSELLASAKSLLDPGDLSGVQSDFELPASGPYASAIEWASSDPSLIEIQGHTARVTRPQAVDTEVTLTATLSLNGETTTKTFTATVNSLAAAAPVARYSFNGDLVDTAGSFAAGSVTGNRLDNTGGSVSFQAGKVGEALSLDGTSGVKLPDDLIDGSRYSFGVWLNPQALNQFTPAFFGAASTSSWISLVPFGPGDAGNTMLWSGEAWYDGDTGTQIATGNWTHFAAVVNAGEITLYLDGEEVFTGTGFPDVFSTTGGEFGVGVNYWDTPYEGMVDELVIYDEAISAEVVQSLANE